MQSALTFPRPFLRHSLAMRVGYLGTFRGLLPPSRFRRGWTARPGIFPLLWVSGLVAFLFLLLPVPQLLLLLPRRLILPFPLAP